MDRGVLQHLVYHQTPTAVARTSAWTAAAFLQQLTNSKSRSYGISYSVTGFFVVTAHTARATLEALYIDVALTKLATAEKTVAVSIATTTSVAPGTINPGKLATIYMIL